MSRILRLALQLFGYAILFLVIVYLGWTFILKALLLKLLELEVLIKYKDSLQ